MWINSDLTSDSSIGSDLSSLSNSTSSDQLSYYSTTSNNSYYCNSNQNTNVIARRKFPGSNKGSIHCNQRDYYRYYWGSSDWLFSSEVYYRTWTFIQQILIVILYLIWDLVLIIMSIVNTNSNSDSYQTFLLPPSSQASSTSSPSSSMSESLLQQNIILNDTRGKARYRGYKVNLYLTPSCLYIYYVKGKSSSTENGMSVGKLALQIHLQDVIGTKIIQHVRKIELSIYTYVFSKRIACLQGQKLRKLSVIKLYFEKELESTAISWSNAINSVAYGNINFQMNVLGNEILPIPRKRIIIFINPVSGKGTARKAWDRVVSRMFDEANVDTLLYFTKHQNDAFEYVSKMEYQKYDMIAILSGDGLIFEVINGINSRSDSEVMLANIPLAVLPGGTANGLVKSILHHSGADYSLVNAVFNLLKGSPHGLDLSCVQTSTKTYKSFLSLSWGLISDIDIMSESMRFLGETRLYVAAMYYIFAKKIYRGRLSMLLVDENNNPTNKLHVIEDDFVGVWVLQTSHSASTVHSGPGVKLNDGIFTILVITSKISRCSLLSLLITIDGGDHIKNPSIDFYKATAYKIEPLTDKGIYSLDGELIEYGPLEGTVEPSAARVIAM